MLNKSMIALTAAVILGSASAAFASEDAENRIGDRYPSLDQSSRTIVASSMGNRMMAARQVSGTNRVAYADAENRIGDRYPSLEQSNAPVASSNIGFRMPTVRFVASGAQLTTNDPESQIGDKYPLLERTNTQRAAGFVTAGRHHKMPKNKA